MENVGAHSARNCNVKLLSVKLASGKQEELPLQSTSVQKSLKHTDCSGDSGYVESGSTSLFELGEISVGSDETQAGCSVDATLASKACIELHLADGTIERLRPHQSNINILINLCAVDFVPKKYIVNIEWKGESVADIGSAGSFSCGVKLAKK